MINNVLAIETSCDDTSVAIVRAGGLVVAQVSANQDLAHAPFGGIVPEIACRNHSQNLLPLIEKCLEKAEMKSSEVESLAVTNRPGLIGSLIVGLIVAKSLAQSWKIPLIGVNHLEGHIVAPFLKDESFQPPAGFDFPFIALTVSGGHTSIYHVPKFSEYRLLGSSLDDAAGEAFDKFGKMIGLEWPGGAKVDQLAKTGDPKAFALPRSMIKEDNCVMSFSGLKASGQRLVESMSQEEVENRKADLCASYQEAIVDVLIAKLDKAVRMHPMKNVIVSGGVSANSRLRQRAQEWATSRGLQLVIPPIRYCTDNAAMIGYAGLLRLQRGETHPLSLGPSPSAWEGDFV